MPQPKLTSPELRSALLAVNRSPDPINYTWCADTFGERKRLWSQGKRRYSKRPAADIPGTVAAAPSPAIDAVVQDALAAQQPEWPGEFGDDADADNESNIDDDCDAPAALPLTVDGDEFGLQEPCPSPATCSTQPALKDAAILKRLQNVKLDSFECQDLPATLTPWFPPQSGWQLLAIPDNGDCGVIVASLAIRAMAAPEIAVPSVGVRALLAGMVTAASASRWIDDIECRYAYSSSILERARDLVDLCKGWREALQTNPTEVVIALKDLIQTTLFLGMTDLDILGEQHGFLPIYINADFVSLDNPENFSNGLPPPGCAILNRPLPPVTEGVFTRSCSGDSAVHCFRRRPLLFVAVKGGNHFDLLVSQQCVLRHLFDLEPVTQSLVLSAIDEHPRRLIQLLTGCPDHTTVWKTFQKSNANSTHKSKRRKIRVET